MERSISYDSGLTSHHRQNISLTTDNNHTLIFSPDSTGRITPSTPLSPHLLLSEVISPFVSTTTASENSPVRRNDATRNIDEEGLTRRDAHYNNADRSMEQNLSRSSTEKGKQKETDLITDSLEHRSMTQSSPAWSSKPVGEGHSASVNTSDLHGGIMDDVRNYGL